MKFVLWESFFGQIGITLVCWGSECLFYRWNHWAGFKLHSHILLRCWFQFKISEGGVRCDMSNSRDLFTFQKVNIPFEVWFSTSVASHQRFQKSLHSRTFRVTVRFKGLIPHKMWQSEYNKGMFKQNHKNNYSVQTSQKLSDKRNTQRVEGFRSFLVHLHIKPILPQWIWDNQHISQ